MAPPVPRTEEVRRLVHALREPIGAFVIHTALLEDEKLSDPAREHVTAMLGNVARMVEALAAITACFELELGDATPLAMIDAENRRANAVSR